MGIPFRLQLGVALGCCLLDGKWRMHAPKMLGEEVLAVEFVAFAIGTALRT
jgi:hypothetical protein